MSKDKKEDVKSSNTDPVVVGLKADLAALTALVESQSKEIDALKAVKPAVSSGKDSRVDKLIEAFKKARLGKFLE